MGVIVNRVTKTDMRPNIQLFGLRVRWYDPTERCYMETGIFTFHDQWHAAMEFYSSKPEPKMLLGCYVDLPSSTFAELLIVTNNVCDWIV